MGLQIGPGSFPSLTPKGKHTPKSSRLRGSGSFSAKRERPTGPRRETTAREPLPRPPILRGATALGALAAPVHHPEWQITRQKPLIRTPLTGAASTGGGPRLRGAWLLGGRAPNWPGSGSRATRARTGRGVRGGTPGGAAEGRGPRRAWWAAGHPAALQPPAGKQTKGREASGGDDRPLSLGKVTLQLPSQAPRVPAPRPGRRGAPSRAFRSPPGACWSPGSLRPPPTANWPSSSTRSPDCRATASGIRMEKCRLRMHVRRTSHYTW